MDKRKTKPAKNADPMTRESRVRFALRPFARARGLLASGDFEGVLMMAPCRDIHTAGMRVPIDVAFVDANGMILEAHRRVGPFRRLRNRHAACVIERVSRCESPWFRKGEHVGLASVRDSGGKGGRR